VELPYVEELTPPPDPVHCCAALARLPYRLFLDSAAPGPRLGRYSFLMADPAILVRARAGQVSRVDRLSGIERIEPGDLVTVLRAAAAPFAATPIPGLPPFQGGAAGLFAYDWGRSLERLPANRYQDLDLPDAALGVYDWVIAWDHGRNAVWLISTGLPETEPEARGRRAEARAREVRALLGQVTSASPGQDLRGARTLPASAGARSGSRSPRTPAIAAPSYPVEGGWWGPELALRSSFTRADYLVAIERVREYIRAGDIFQANLSQRFETELGEPAWACYLRLRERNAAPFAAFMELPEGSILSASPERFLHVDTQGAVETRPIKGTRPRGVGPEHDAALGAALTESAKDRAENLMIVDLMRNDLSRVCLPGTVRVPELFTLERYATVHHLVSTVVGQLEPGLDALDLLRAAFPGGSITGAPKVRAMEIIAELEPSSRGVYCGSIGYWSVTGELDTNIAIRTALVQRGRVYFSAGGGIIADSDPEQEYLETLHKARGFIDALPRR
jgi:para-aminobenzoate synthetase component I